MWQYACLPLVVDLRCDYHLVLLLLSLQHLLTVDTITKAVDFVFLLIAEATGRWVFARDVYRLRVRSGEPMMTLGSRTKAHTWNESTGTKKCIPTKPNIKNSQRYFFFFFKSCITTNQGTIISQINTLLLHVSTLMCHHQGARSQYLAKLHKYVKCSWW